MPEEDGWQSGIDGNFALHKAVVGGKHLHRSESTLVI
jgi:hypothetical protein